MIVPLTHEHASVRQWPWITFAVIAACTVAFLWTSSDTAGRRAEEQYFEAIRYWQSHPYLEPDPRMLPHEVVQRFATRWEPPPGTDVEQEQTRLDRLTREWAESLEEHPLWKHGLVPARFSVSGLFTHMFLHAGFLHLLGNMLILYLAGPFVEDAWGRPAFAGFYLGAGALAAGLYALRYSTLTVPLVGASGAVAAVLGAFLFLRWRTRIHFLLFLGIMVGTFSAPAWLMLPLWFFGELVSAVRADALMPEAGGGGIAYWVHVFGFLLGVAAAWGMRRWRGSEIPVLVAGPVAHPAIEQARKELDRGMYPRAWTLLARASVESPDDEGVAEELWGLARRLGRQGEVRSVGRKLLRGRLQAGDVEGARRLLAELEEEAADDPELPELRVRVATALAAEAPEESRRLLRRVTGSDLGSLPPPVVIQMVRSAAQVDPELARRFGAGALARTDLDPKTRDLLRQAVESW